MWARLYYTFAEAFDLLLPPTCLLCSRELSSNTSRTSFCAACTANTNPLSQGHCRCCAQAFASSASSHLCSNCLTHPPPFSMVHAAGTYNGSIRDAVHRLKYRNQLALASSLGAIVGASLDSTCKGFAPGLVVPVPLHSRRLRRRGYNQSLEIARPIAKQLGIPLDPVLLQRTRNTPQQQGLTAKERRQNLRSAFTLTDRPTASRILLIDDVMTTGETVRECSRTLIKGGAKEVQVAVVGRA